MGVSVRRFYSFFGCIFYLINFKKSQVEQRWHVKMNINNRFQVINDVKFIIRNISCLHCAL